MHSSVYLNCKNNYTFAKITNQVPMIISEAGREIERFVIFVVRANLSPPPLGPQSSGGMNHGVKIGLWTSPLGVRKNAAPPLIQALTISVSGDIKESRS